MHGTILSFTVVSYAVKETENNTEICALVSSVIDQFFFELVTVQTYSKMTVLFWNTHNLSTGLTNNTHAIHKESTVSVFALRNKTYSYSLSKKEQSAPDICNAQCIHA